ncbi:unnamed protein product [Tilletia controversa]|uniref:Glycosyltransferase 2-like domain-containing protein n=3 Tax=Tilletia TaxID=13289 RepID=A0A8X7SZT3_9BASI|nr:hypothetical protein CF328_g4157 [Tilletia controversa]KAE8197086.1 hypothetical protein CF335_g4701 [Tilletia laevis]KAE8256814.1 hypothetical protein A4X03_0g5030 [Tilletia caries]KAE8198077.1 hypothetical protein CF336_g1856 [Tilletia laevis]KAE8253475.1 hypothetical protein A4X06_0g1429 [Tilletia controversa]
MISAFFKGVSDFINEWTPLALLFCYACMSFFFYLVIPDSLHTGLWYCFICLQTFVTFTVLAEVVFSVRPSVLARRVMRKAEKEGFPDMPEEKCPRIDVVFVAYLPNEQDIILRQIRYAIRQSMYPSSKLHFYIVYNTPYDIPGIEQELRKIERQCSNLTVFRVPNSTSKAENLNFFLQQKTRGDITTILDTDHFLEKNALYYVGRRFLTGDVDVIQGRCCVYNHDESWLTKLVAAEVDVIYGAMHPGRAELQGYGLFGGSNGHWNTSLLRTLQLNPNMLTEDIDVALRAITSGARVAYDLKVVSYETAPATVMALFKQRSRWAQGWTQVFLKHTRPALERGAYGSTYRSRFGLFFLLAFREFYFYFISQFTFMLFSQFLTNPPKSWNALYSTFVGFSLSIWILVLNMSCLSAITFVTLRNTSSFVRPKSVITFMAASPLYFTIVSMVAIMCHFREFTGFKRWNPTARTNASQIAQPLPSLARGNETPVTIQT